MAATITITDQGDSVKITDTAGTPKSITFPKNSTVFTRLGSNSVDHFKLTAYGEHTTTIDHTKVVSPTVADADALEAVLDAYFFKVANNTTYTVLLADISSGNLPAGQWVFVSDILDEGAWVFCTSASTVGSDVRGMFLNCDWNDEGDAQDYASILAVSGVAYSGNNYGQWSFSFEGFVLTVVDGTGFVKGDGVTAFGAVFWIGVVIAVSGNTLQVVSTNEDKPGVGDTVTGIIGGSSEITNVGLKNSQGSVVAYMDTATQKEYSHWICIDSAMTNYIPPPQNTAAYVELPRRAQVVTYSGGHVFTTGEAISNGSSWRGVVTGVNLSGKVVVSVRRGSPTLQVGATITGAGGSGVVTGVVVADRLGYRGVSNAAVFDFVHTDDFTGMGWLEGRADGDNKSKYTYGMDQAMGAGGHSIVNALPWGSPTFNFNDFDNGKYFIDNPMSPVRGVSTGVGSDLSLSVVENSSVSFLRAEAGATGVIEAKEGSEVKSMVLGMNTTSDVGVNEDGILRNLTVGIGAVLDLTVNATFNATGVYITPGEVVSETIISDVTNVTFP